MLSDFKTLAFTLVLPLRRDNQHDLPHPSPQRLACTYLHHSNHLVRHDLHHRRSILQPHATMPRIPISRIKQEVEQRRRHQLSIAIHGSTSSLPSLSSSLSTDADADADAPPAPPEPLALIYNIRHDTFRQAPRSSLVKQDVSSSPLVELPYDMPPLLVDGRMQIVEVPRWKRKVGFYWRTSDGEQTRVLWRSVKLPGRIWWQRNFGEKLWTELWIERC